MKLLVIDSSVRSPEESRTAQLCERFVAGVTALHPDWETERLCLRELGLKPLDAAALRERDEVLARQDWGHPMLALARQFAAAERIVLAAPYWDLCFPSMLKVYLEHIFVCGVTFEYQGADAVGKCRAQELLYLQSAGGFLGENDPGRVYIQAVCRMFGVARMESFCAQGLDIQELDYDALWASARGELDALAESWGN